MYVVDSESRYQPMSPQDIAAELGLQLSQRLQPDFSVAVPKRIVTREEAKARRLAWYWDSSACRLGHQAARRTSNPGICSDCERLKNSPPLEPVYPRSKTQKYYPEPRRPSKDPSAPVVIAAPAPAAPPEPSKKETEFLAALAEHGNLDKACAAVGWPRAQMEARYSVNEVFRRAVDATLERLQIPRTLKAPSTFAWTDAVKRSLISQFVDTGLLHTAREAVGVSASEFFARIDSDPAFAAAIEAARPRAAETLRDRATQAAAVGKIDLLKYLEAGAPKDGDISNMSVEQMHVEIRQLIDRFDKQGLIHHQYVYRHAKTGAQIDLREYEAVDDSDNADLIS